MGPNLYWSLHLADELSKLFVDAGPFDAPTFPGPMPSKTVPIPWDYGVRVQSDHQLPPIIDKAGEDEPKKRSPRVGQTRFERLFIITSCCRRARSCRDRQHDLSHERKKSSISMRSSLWEAQHAAGLITLALQTATTPIPAPMALTGNQQCKSNAAPVAKPLSIA